MDDTYYFVPLGRERGGLLDFLGLPPSASQEQVNARFIQYTQYLETDLADRIVRMELQLLVGEFKRGRIIQKEFDRKLEMARNGLLRGANLELGYKRISQEEYDLKIQDLKADIAQLIASAEKSLITKEEVDAQTKLWDSEKTELEMRVTQLKESYELARGRQRELMQNGLTDDSVIWVETYSSSQDQQVFWRLVLGRCPLSQVGIARPASSGKSVAVTKLDSLASLRELLDRRDRQCLEWADLLWTNQGGTNRRLWQEKIKAWVAELEQSGPFFDLSSARGSTPVAPEFPSLCEPTSLAIDRLAREELEELTQTPKRAGPAAPPDLASLLARLLANAKSIEADNEQQGATDGAETDTEAAFGDFLDFMRNALDATLAGRSPQRTQR